MGTLPFLRTGWAGPLRRLEDMREAEEEGEEMGVAHKRTVCMCRVSLDSIQRVSQGTTRTENRKSLVVTQQVKAQWIFYGLCCSFFFYETSAAGLSLACNVFFFSLLWRCCGALIWPTEREDSSSLCRPASKKGMRVKQKWRYAHEASINASQPNIMGGDSMRIELFGQSSHRHLRKARSISPARF